MTVLFPKVVSVNQGVVPSGLTFEEVMDFFVSKATELSDEESRRALARLAEDFAGAVDFFNKDEASRLIWAEPGNITLTLNPTARKVTWKRDDGVMPVSTGNFAPRGAMKSTSLPLPKGMPMAEAMGWLSVERVIIHAPITPQEMRRAFSQPFPNGQNSISQGRVTIILNPYMNYAPIFKKFPPSITLPRLFNTIDTTRHAQIAQQPHLLDAFCCVLEQLTKLNDAEAYKLYFDRFSAVVRKFIAFNEGLSRRMTKVLWQSWIPYLMMLIKRQNGAVPEFVQNEFLKVMTRIVKDFEGLNGSDLDYSLKTSEAFIRLLMSHMHVPVVKKEAERVLKAYSGWLDRLQTAAELSEEHEEAVMAQMLRFHADLRSFDYISIAGVRQAPFMNLMSDSRWDTIRGLYKSMTRHQDVDRQRRLIDQWNLWMVFLHDQHQEATTKSLKSGLAQWRRSIQGRIQEILKGNEDLEGIIKIKGLYSVYMERYPAATESIEKAGKDFPVLQELIRLDWALILTATLI